jgi:2-oxoglutarate dehydrogenase complex dehydrogenase (E1) component-like enzyme
MAGKDDRLQELKSRVSGAVSRRNEIRERVADGEELDRARDDLKDARKEMKRELKNWEKQWWEEIISKCKEAGEKGESGTIYKTLRELGKRGWKGPEQSTRITTAEFRDHFQQVSKDRFENTPEEIE